MNGSISFRVAILTTLVGCVTSAGALFAMYSYYSDQARDTIRLKSEAITHSLDAAASILGESPELVRMVHALGAEAGVKAIHLLNRVTARVVASTDNSMIGNSDSKLLERIPRGNGSEQSRTSHQDFIEGIYRISLPVVFRGRSGELTTGMILLEMDASPVHAEALRGMSEPAVIMLLGLLLTLTIVLTLLHRTVFRPITQVQQAMRSFARGVSTTRVSPLGANAVGALGEQLNRLFDSVCAARLHVEKQQLELIAARDEAEKATRLKSEFLATMSHEIRTPLNAIMGMAQMLTSAKLPDKQSRYARIILDSAGMLLELINDILDISRIEAGKVTVEQAPFSLHGLLAELTEMQAPKARDKRLDLVLNVSPGVPDQVSGDAHRLRQVLLNLLSNGVKFTSSGAVCLTVESSPEVTNHVRFAVQDSGVGIAQEAQGRLFAKFSQADASTTRRFGGSGLGLAICRQLVELMGGRIGFESRLGAGSTFWFEVQLQSGSDEASKNGSPRLRGHDGQPARVLIIDDQEICARAGQSMIAAAGGISDWVPDAVTALEQLAQAAIRRSSYDVVLLDKRLVEEGHVARVLREAERQCVPVVVWSGDGEAQEEARSRYPAVRGSVSRIAPSGRLQEVLQAAIMSAAPARVAAEHVAERPARRWEDGLSGLSVIIADDIESHRTMFQSFLEQEGCRVGLAEDGLGALELRASGEYDVIIMDCYMPVMDGFEATRQIRGMEREFGWSSIPVIAISGHVGQKDRDRSLKAGINVHLAKPVDLNELKRTILVEVCGAPAGGEAGQPAMPGQVEAAETGVSGDRETTLFANPSILVAEDCEVNGEVATALLEMMGCNVTIARDGKAALELCTASEFDLILLDVQMPEMDGLEAAGRLRDLMAAGTMRKTPIIAFTANALKGDREKCLAAGMDDYIEKPIDQLVMAGKLRKWLPPHLHARTSADAWIPVDEATLNPASFRSVRNMMKGRFETYMGMFVRETRRQLDIIRNGVTGNGSAADVAMASGALRQACGQVGATKLSYVAGIIEDMVAEIRLNGGDLQSVRAHAERMEALFAELEVEIRRYLRTDWAQMAS